MRSTTARRPWSRRARARLATTLSATGALLLAVTVVWQSASAGFTDATAPLGATVGTATLTLTDDDAGRALFTASGLKPGNSTARKCVTVRSAPSTKPVDVRMYVTGSPDRVVAGNLTVTVRVGTGGSYASCTGFQSQSSVTRHLADLPTTWSSGVLSWSAPAAGGSRTYEITATLDATTPTSAQSRTTGVTFAWESHFS